MTQGPYQPPSWARRPQLTMSALEVYKKGKLVEIVKDVNRKKMTIFGRNKDLCDIVLQHPSISRQHAAIVHGSSGNMYLIDLGSSHGSTNNKQRLTAEKREVLRDGDIIRFGASTREYHVRLRLDEEEGDEESEEERQSSRSKRKRSRDEETEKSSKSKKSKRDDSSDEKDDKVSCRHLLVKHKDSRRPHSWKSDQITRSKEEALEIIKGFRKQLLEADGEIENAFIELAKTESDCNSNKRGGDLGKFGRGKMQKPFEDTAFSLKVGELSEPVETQSGIHLIYRYQ